MHVHKKCVYVVHVFMTWGPFLERPGNLPGPISVFGNKIMFLNRGQFLLALNTKLET